jgi:hypothetical protein
MLYGSRTLVLWYEDYSTSYTYTRIGSIESAEGLAAAVGQGDVSVGLAAVGGTPSSMIDTATPTIVAPPPNRANGLV